MGMPAWAANPYQCINYVSCHDNHTLFDRIALTAPKASMEDRIRMNRLAAAFSILSQGVPFFHAGEEKDLLLIFNASTDTVNVTLPEGSWNVMIQDDTAGTNVLAAKETSVEAAPISATVLVKA